MAPYYPLYLRSIKKTASSFAVEPIAVEVLDDAEIEHAISTLAGEPDGGLIVMPDSFNMVHRRTTIALADRYRLPAIYRSRLRLHPRRQSRSRAGSVRTEGAAEKPTPATPSTDRA
jgi:hypothetical protein